MAGGSHTHGNPILGIPSVGKEKPGGLTDIDPVGVAPHGPESRCPTYDDLRRISMLDPYTCSCFSSVMYIDGRSNYSIFEPNLHIDFVNALHLHVTPLKRPKMDASTRAMVEAIHANPTQAVLYLSGGASQAFGWLLSLPGASNTVLEAIVPYSRMSVIQLLGKVPS
ncbi:hypothetical protein ACS0TY_027716 [Phlomoides rotata]